jgi:hypothetical protein
MTRCWNCSARGASPCVSRRQRMASRPPSFSTTDWGYVRLRMGEYSRDRAQKPAQAHPRPGVARCLRLLQARGFRQGPRFASMLLEIAGRGARKG